jgi:hypothetical protein
MNCQIDALFASIYGLYIDGLCQEQGVLVRSQCGALVATFVYIPFYE